MIPLFSRSNHKGIGRALARSVVIGIIIIVIVAGAIAAVEIGMHHTAVPSSTNTTTVTPPVTKNVTITYFDDLSPSEASVMQDLIIPQFEKMYPNIHVNYVDEGASDIVKSVEELELSGNVGSVIIGEDNLVIGELLSGNYLMNLTPYASQILQNVSLIPSMKSLVNYEQSVYHGEFFIP
ncbi:MAG: carbohydrate ABC transporter substrate-binding protein, partial [Metallosphaera sp.]